MCRRQKLASDNAHNCKHANEIHRTSIHNKQFNKNEPCKNFKNCDNEKISNEQLEKKHIEEEEEASTIQTTTLNREKKEKNAQREEEKQQTEKKLERFNIEIHGLTILVEIIMDLNENPKQKLFRSKQSQNTRVTLCY